MKQLISYILLSLILSLNFSLISLAQDADTDQAESEYNFTNATLEEGRGPRCDDSAQAIIGQDANGNYICATIGGPNDDADGDHIPNGQDKCPLKFNPDEHDQTDKEFPDDPIDVNWTDTDFDGLNDGTGADQCDATDQTAQLTDAFREYNETAIAIKSQSAYQETLNAIGTCLPTQSGAHSICNSSQINKDSSEQFKRLNTALQNTEIIQILNEPISNENIFKKARICSTKFLRDANGIIQPADRTNLYRTYGPAAITNIINSSRFIITNNKCEEFFVEQCSPSPPIEDSILLTEDLPTRVSCSQVQVLFASSGTDLLKVYVGLIYRWATGIIGVIAVIVILINGIMISASNGDSAKMEEAKSRIIRSLVGLALLFFSGILLYSINPTFFRPNAGAGVDHIVPTNPDNETPDADADAPAESEEPAETASE